jgi:hypothetical protein
LSVAIDIPFCAAEDLLGQANNFCGKFNGELAASLNKFPKSKYIRAIMAVIYKVLSNR